MKKFTFLILAIAFSALSFAKPAKVDIKTNITCGGCVPAIEGAMKDVKGIEKTSVDVASKVVTVNFDDEVINSEKLTNLIVGAGYTAELVDGGKSINAEPKQCGTEKKCCKTKDKKVKKS